MDNAENGPKKAPGVITARTLGVYVFMTLKGAPTSSGDLAKAFGGDRKTYLKDLQALVKAGLVRKTIQVVNGRPVTSMVLTDESPLNGLQLLLSQQNSPLILNAYSLISKKEYFRERKEERMYDEYENAPMYLEPEERAEYLRKAREKRDAKHREERDARVASRIKEKANRTPAEWTTDDSAYYFAERVSLMWNVEPWTSVRTRFKAAFGRARKEYGTTGDIELKMMERFFEGLEHRKHITNPEVIWKVFIRDFGALLTAVEHSNVTQEDIDKAEEILKRQWEKYSV